MSKEYFGDITSAYKYVVDKLPGVQNIVWTPGQDTMIINLYEEKDIIFRDREVWVPSKVKNRI